VLNDKFAVFVIDLVHCFSHRMGFGGKHLAMNSDDNVHHQPQHAQQKPVGSFKLLKLLATLAAVLLIALVVGTGGYLLRAGNNQFISLLYPTPLVQVETVSQVIPTITQSPLAVRTKNWKTYTSSYGYSIRYPSDMEHEESGGYPFDLRIRNEDLTITFILQTLPQDKKVEEYAMDTFCDDRPNEIKKDEINNVLVYRVEKNLSDNKLCLQAVIGLNTFLINPSQPKSQWILDIQALNM
jgi:hypothetical protein